MTEQVVQVDRADLLDLVGGEHDDHVQEQVVGSETVAPEESGPVPVAAIEDASGPETRVLAVDDLVALDRRADHDGDCPRASWAVPPPPVLPLPGLAGDGAAADGVEGGGDGEPGEPAGDQPDGEAWSRR